MDKIFTIQRNDNDVVLFNLKDIGDLKAGEIFFIRKNDGSTEILQDFEYLDKNYLDSIVDKLSEEEQYDFSLLIYKLI
jgi:hypothetical protein